MTEIILSLSAVKPETPVEEPCCLERESGRWFDQAERRKGFELLLEAQHYWDKMEKFRRDRERNKSYAYGNQWSDYITVDGERMTEEQYIIKQGNIPLKNNLIRRLMNNVLGVYHSQSKEPTCVARDRDEQQLGEAMSTVLQYNMQLNRMHELYARSMEEFLISGVVVHRKWYGEQHDKLDCWTDYVQPNNFFIDNNMRDFRGWDCSFIGEIHDESFENLRREFATNPEEDAALHQIYFGSRQRDVISSNCEYFGFPEPRNWDFLLTGNTTRCRLVEIWRKESKPRYRCHDYNTGEIYKIDPEHYTEMVSMVNAARIERGLAQGLAQEDIPLIEAEWIVDTVWHYYYVTPTGVILRDAETPYTHKSHPYVFKIYPFIDGEVHSFVADIIDQQRYVNRLISMYDWIMRASAKGLLLVPEGAIPEGMSKRDYMETWSSFNGVLFYRPKPGVPMPAQISNNSTNIGIHELLQMQLKFFEDVSGVNGALQGKAGYSGVSGALYAQQTQNATMSLLDKLEVFSSFVVDAAYKDVKNLQQFYDDKRMADIAGRTGKVDIDDPRKIKDVEVDLSIVESQATPAYRLMANEFLMELWRAGQLSLIQLLESGDFPNADQLIQSLKAQERSQQQALMAQQAEAAGAMPEGAMPQAMPPIQSPSAPAPSGGAVDPSRLAALRDAMEGTPVGTLSTPDSGGSVRAPVPPIPTR